MNKFFKKLHLWVSVPFGLVITITCFTGAMLVFESEITELCNDDLTTVEPKGEPLPVDELVARVLPILPEDVEITGVTLSSSPDEAYKVNLSKPHRAAVYIDQYTGEVKGRHERLPFFDVMRRLHRWLMDDRPQDDSIYWGKMIVGASTLAFVVILLTGIVVWWPRNRKMLKNRLQITVKKGKNRFWYDLHVAGGIYAVLFLLAMALTGLTWSFEWYRDGFYGALGVEMKQEGKKGSADGRKIASAGKAKGEEAPAERTCPGDCSQCDGVPCGKNPAPVAEVQTDAVSGATTQTDAVSGATAQADAVSGATAQADAVSGATAQADAVSGATAQADAVSGATAQADAVSGATTQATILATDNVNYDYWQEAIEAVEDKYDEYETMTVSDGVVTVVEDDLGNQRASDKFRFDAWSGEIVSVEEYEESPVHNKASGWVRTIHVGAWGGMFSKILYFLAALLGAALPVTGYYFWIRKLYFKKKK